MADHTKQSEPKKKSRRDFLGKATVGAMVAGTGAAVAGAGAAEAQEKPILSSANVKLDSRAKTRSVDDATAAIRGAILAKAQELARTYGGRSADDFHALFSLSWP